MKDKISLLIAILAILILLFLVYRIIVIAKEIIDIKSELEKFRKNIDALQNKIKKIEQGKIEVKATAYSSCIEECDSTPFITASGAKVRWGIIAMDKRYKFGTKVYIPFFKKTFVVLDRGGAIKGNRIDIWFPSKEEAKKFGVKNLIVYVLGR
ncbi:MAG: 3D domain-containing protein [Thermodesulfovibrio sp.]|nr:3D domain-containing protein [Thermodesulfovibrio sp.]